MPTNNRTVFKRLNFFTGFFTTAEDWLQGQEYHLEKRKLHLRGLHTPGIIPGDGEELKVTAGGGLSVRVGSGAALDREGNLLYLPAAKTIPITLPENLPKTVYIYIKYAENPTDSQYNVDYPEYSGPSRVSENPKITASPIAPEQFDGVVLASIALQPGVTEVIDAANNTSPGPNEIDTRAATLAGAVDRGRDVLAAKLAAQLAELDAAQLARSQRLRELLLKVHEYHLAQQRRHNKGLHVQGLIPDVLEELAVRPVGGLDVEVRPGAALDGAGNGLYLDQAVQLSIPPATAPRRVYIVAGYEDCFSTYLRDLESPSDMPTGAPSGDGHYRTLKVSLAYEAPDPKAWIELARIDLAAGATEVRLPADPGRPQQNEIDRRYVRKAGAVDRRFDDLQVLIDERTRDLLGRVQRMYQAFSEDQWEHNRALFTPGLLSSAGEEMRVDPAGGLTVEVGPGAALDSLGRRLRLGAPERVPITPVEKPTIIYIYAAYEDHFGAYLNDPKPDARDSNASGTPFSDFSTARLGCTERLQADWLELARIDLAPDATEIRRPADPARPGRNEIDQRALRPALARAAVEPRLPAELLDRIIELMRLKRGAFAALNEKFPIPSAADVRQAAVNIEVLARNESLRPKRLAEVLGMLATLEQDVGQEIGKAYPPVVDKPKFKRYQDTVAALAAALYARENEQVLLNRQDEVVAAARDLAEVVFEAPEADAGQDQTIPTLTGQADVTLDAGRSQAHADQKIRRYHWDKEE